MKKFPFKDVAEAMFDDCSPAIEADLRAAPDPKVWVIQFATDYYNQVEGWLTPFLMDPEDPRVQAKTPPPAPQLFCLLTARGRTYATDGITAASLPGAHPAAEEYPHITSIERSPDSTTTIHNKLSAVIEESPRIADNLSLDLKLFRVMLDRMAEILSLDEWIRISWDTQKVHLSCGPAEGIIACRIKNNN